MAPAALAATCFGALFALPAEVGAGHVHRPGWTHSAMGHGAMDHSAMNLHLQGMWLAFAVAAFVIAYFVTRVTHDLEAQRREATLAQARALRSEKLASLATLAAGAAHELATPLATIAVVAKELERDLSRAPNAEGSAADARLIRDEVERCKHILEHMATDAARARASVPARVPVRALIDRSLDALAERERGRSSSAPGAHCGCRPQCSPARCGARAQRAAGVDQRGPCAPTRRARCSPSRSAIAAPA